ncbi:MAG TPA: tetratricopeptide repeat protein [Anaerolineae bacterium]|nr:tetratricopeptide repeat protein [Anaerolineae bacterium]
MILIKKVRFLGAETGYKSVPLANALATLNNLAAQEIGDKKLEIKCLSTLANTCNLLCESEKAIEIAEKQAELALRMSDKVAWVDALINQGDARLNQGELTQVIELYQHALQEFRVLRQRSAQSQALGRLGVAYYLSGQHRRSIDFSQRALRIAREEDDRHGEGKWLNNLGLAHAAVGERRWAEDYQQEALAIAQAIGDIRLESSCWGALGLINLALGQSDQALNHFGKAIALCVKVGSVREETYWNGHFGIASSVMGNYEAATNYCQMALARSQSLNDSYQEGLWLGNLASIKHAEWNLFKPESDGAKNLSTTDAIVSEETYLSSVPFSGLQINQLVEVNEVDSPRFKEVREDYEQAHLIAKAIGDLQNACRWQSKLGDLHVDSGLTKKAIRFYKTALQMARQIGDKSTLGMLWGKLGESHYQIGNHSRTLDYGLQGLIILREIEDIEDIEGEFNILQSLGAANKAVGNLPRSLDYYEQSLELLDDLRAGWSEPAHKMIYFGRRVALYSEVISLCMDMGKYVKKAFNLVQQSRSRSFIEELADTSHPQITDQSALEVLLLSVNHTSQELRQLRISLEKAPENLKLELSQEASRKQRELDALLDRIESIPSMTAKEYVDVSRGIPMEFEEIKLCLQTE